MSFKRLFPVVALSMGMTACDLIEGFLGEGDDPSLTAAADDALNSGDLPGAAARYDQLSVEHPDSVYVATGAAYSLLLQGRYDEADAALARVQPNANEEQLPELHLRRAIIALRTNDLDAVGEHGAASGLGPGLVLAAEVHLADLDTDKAKSLLERAASSGGAAGETAKEYLEMLDSDDHVLVGLAEATALWALGSRDVAVEAAEDLVKALPDDDPSKDELLLLWAGRAATSGRPAVGLSMMDAIQFPPKGQAWREQATLAILATADGRDDEAKEIFQSLTKAGAPKDGLADALATAASLAAKRSDAKSLAISVETVSAARGLSAARASAAAKQVAPPSMYRDFLESQ